MSVDLNDVDALVEVADDSLAFLNTGVDTYPPESSVNKMLTKKRDRLQRGRDWLVSMLAAERASIKKSKSP